MSWESWEKSETTMLMFWLRSSPSCLFFSSISKWSKKIKKVKMTQNQINKELIYEEIENEYPEEPEKVIDINEC
jgi:hypothetical protein